MAGAFAGNAAQHTTMRNYTSKQTPNQRNILGYAAAAIACALALLAVYAVDNGHTPYLVRDIFPGGGGRHHIPTKVYLPVHSVFEFASIVVSFAVFTIGYYGYRQTRNRQDLFIAVTFMVVGALDFVHTLSFKGMPNFLGTNSVGGAAAYWVTARLIGACALLAAAFIPQNCKNRLLTPKALLPAATGLVIGIITLFTVYGKVVPGLMYVVTDHGGHLTPLKVALEYAVVALLATAFWAFRRTGRWHSGSARLIRISIIIAIGAEVCFTLYRSAFDGYNLVGHILKVASYYFILQALFVSSLRRPYMELSLTKEQLRQSFTRIGDALASGLRKDTTLKLISSLAMEMLGADFAAIGEIKRRDLIRVDSFSGLCPEPFELPVKHSLTGKAIEAGRPLIVPDLNKNPLARPEILALGIRSFLSAPIQHGSGASGAIYVGSFESGRFTEDDAEVLTAFARQAALALQDAEHYEREHRIADELQHVLFPPNSIERDGYTITGRYQPAWEEARVGGDFYDYFDLGDGKLGIVIGDVSGKGLHAAVHTAIVKYSCQAYLREGYGPANALKRIDQTFKDRSRQEMYPDTVFVTMFCAVLDTATGHLTYANAGHEPAINISKTGESRDLDSTGPILGLGIGIEVEQSEDTIERGGTLVMYTDGITESRVGANIFGFDRLKQTVEGCVRWSTEDMADAICQKALEYSYNHSFGDDVALVLVRRKDE